VFPDKPAIVHRGQATTYAQMAEHALRLGNGLRGLGIQKGDRVAVLAPNTPALLECHFGVPAAGAVLVAINTRLTSNEIGYILADCEARALIVDAELAHLIEPIRGQLPHLRTVISVWDGVGTPVGGPDYEAFLATASVQGASFGVEDEDQLISLNYTSGTTGRPKGVMYTHRGAYLNALSQALELGLSPYTTYLWTLPMFHCNGWCYTWAVTAVGGTHVGLRRVEPAEVFRLVAEHRVTHLCAAPTVLIMLASYAAEQRLSLGQRLRIATGGAPPAAEVIQRLESLGADITHLYGLTETYGPHVICEWQPSWDSLPFTERARLKARQGVADVVSQIGRAHV
jgi:fatty-acyl-CoA synthase